MIAEEGRADNPLILSYEAGVYGIPVSLDWALYHRPGFLVILPGKKTSKNRTQLIKPGSIHITAACNLQIENACVSHVLLKVVLSTSLVQ